MSHEHVLIIISIIIVCVCACECDVLSYFAGDAVLARRCFAGGRELKQRDNAAQRQAHATVQGQSTTTYPTAGALTTDGGASLGSKLCKRT